jgi:hypothetical protein
VRETLSIISLNIHGATSKLEDIPCQDLFSRHDIIFLSELKHSYPIRLPGLKCIRSRIIKGQENRGGVAVLFKHYIWQEVHNIDTLEDQVWFNLHSIPHTKFGAIYIPPRDSPFFNPKSFATIQEHSTQSKVIILGDMNARAGPLQTLNSQNNEIRYTQNPDPVINTHGKELISLCKTQDMLPINHLKINKITCDGKLTFRKRQEWISQLDWAICSKQLVHNIADYQILQDTTLPTDHAPITLKLSGLKQSPEHILSCANHLDEYVQPGIIYKKYPTTASHIDHQLLNENLPQTGDLLENSIHQSIDSLCEKLADTIYSATRTSRKTSNPQIRAQIQNASQRWNEILRSNDDKKLWSSINWKGTFDVPTSGAERPDDATFARHFENLLNPEGMRDPRNYHPPRHIYIPILDDPIQPHEVDQCIKRLKPNKAAGIDCISPGILKLLPDTWIILLTTIFNIIFNGEYPLSWTLMKIFTIYKKGSTLDPNNYRGISVISCIAKVYDMILSKRFSLWYRPKQEQAGAQPGRGCEEQILTVRLIIDIARKTKRKLYIAFIDYQKAYDKVNRWKLVQYLDSQGCGNRFLHALKHSMTSTGQIGTENFPTSAGVKQGSSTSCNSFTSYIDPTIAAVKEIGPDSWLGDLHILLFMDDTVIFATTKTGLINKLRRLKRCADDIGMIIHPSKSQYMSVNDTDKTSIQIDNILIEKTPCYTYLGTKITDENITAQMKLHVESKKPHIHKFYSFLAKNNDCPYIIKRKVWNSALNTTVLYSCETWITTNLQPVEAPYNNTLKNLLAVRQSTCNDLVHIETGLPNAKSIIIDRQITFLKKMRNRKDDSYIIRIINLAIAVKSPMGKRIKTLENMPNNQKEIFMSELRARVSTSDSTRRKMYIEMNPSMKTCSILQRHDPSVKEYHRISMTRLRLGSHHLKVETGRWARIPFERRLCSCGEIQTEAHVLLHCRHSQHLRWHLQNQTISELFQGNTHEISKYCHDILTLYRT